MHPLISVVMPTYNRASYLLSAVDSLIKQTYVNFELIIIDNNSNDNTETIINNFKDDRIRYIKINENKGEYWSTNYAISLSKGDYVTWLHSDDLLPGHSLENRIKTLLGSSDLSFVHGDIEKIDEKGDLIERLSAIEDCSNEIFRRYISSLQKGEMQYLIHHTTILMTKEFFYKAGPMDETLPFAGDIDWLVRALYYGTYKKAQDVLYYYRIHSQSRSVLDIQNGVDKKEVRKMIGDRYKSFS